MDVLIADRKPAVITAVEECNPSFDFELGDPLAYDIDAVVSPANTMGIMNGGYDAVLRRYFGVTIEMRVRQYIDKFPVSVGEAISVLTGHEKVPYLIVSPTVSVSGEGLSGHESVSYSCAYASVIAAHKRGASYLGMTGLGTGVGGLSVRDAVRQQVKGIEDALERIANDMG